MIWVKRSAEANEQKRRSMVRKSVYLSLLKFQAKPRNLFVWADAQHANCWKAKFFKLFFGTRFLPSSMPSSSEYQEQLKLVNLAGSLFRFPFGSRTKKVNSRKVKVPRSSLCRVFCSTGLAAAGSAVHTAAPSCQKAASLVQWHDTI